MDIETNSEKGKRIARNTLLLYCRMLLLLFVGLYTSRVVLDALGIDDYGVYNAVGGVVAFFSVVSSALTSAISRFITFELGKPDSSVARLRQIFRNSVKIQFMMAGVIILLAETVGVWFLNAKMNIPVGRMGAANCVLQFSILTFAINLVSIPFNAAIIAHEKMKAFAYIGIFEGMAKLGVAFLLLAAPFDRLVYYAMLMCIVALLVRLAYSIFCRRSFEECSGRNESEDGTMDQLKQMLSFAGWNFIGASSAVLRDHGGNLLINVFCGPAVNAAKGVTTQLSGAVQGFVNNFMTAMNPQITKAYAGNDRNYMMTLVFKGARLSYFMLLFLSLPLIVNMDFVLDIWLKEVPPHAANFVILALFFAMSESLSNPLITVQLATGDIKKYQIIVGGIQLLNVPIAWALLAMGCEPECVLIVAIVLSQVCLFARLFLLKKMVGFNVWKYILDVYVRVVLVTFGCFVPRITTQAMAGDSWGSFFVSACICCLISLILIWAGGLEDDEKTYIKNKLRK